MSGSALFSATRSHTTMMKQYCFEGILRGSSEDENGNTLVYFTPKEEIFHVLNREPSTIGICNSSYDLYQYYSGKSRTSTILNLMPEEIINWHSTCSALIIEVYNLCKNEVVAKAFETIRLHNKGTITLILYCVDLILIPEYKTLSPSMQALLSSNVIPVFRNRSLDCSWKIINSKINSSWPIACCPEIKDTYIYLGFQGFFPQQAALMLYSHLVACGHQVYDNILYDRVPKDFHSYAIERAKIIVLFYSDDYYSELQQSTKLSIS